MKIANANPDRVHSAERMAGERAKFHVYYRHGTKLRFDPIWTKDTAAGAESEMIGFFKELRMKNTEILQVVKLDPTTSIEA